MPTDAVVGIDTRSRSFHWVSSIPLGPARRRWGFIEAPADTDVEIARAKLYREAREFFRFVPYGSSVFCEEPLALRQNPNTTRLLCMAAAAVWCGLVATERSITWYWTNPATWKKAVLGKGAPPKGQKHKPWIEQELLANPEFLTWLDFDRRDRGEFQLNPDLYDAWCLMAHGTAVLHSLHGR